jgi:hypothetical protein
VAKCLVVRRDDFGRALSTRPPDHFLLGRMVQRVAVVWSRSPSDESWVAQALSGARAGVLEWVGPYLQGTFDAEAVGRRLLEVSYNGELRPEAQNRSDKVFEAQREHFREHLGEGLEAAVRGGRLDRVGNGSYRFRVPPTPAERSRWRRYFLLSEARSTLRWFKHVITFDNWLPYIARKVERHTGQRVELTAWERRAPLIFLWPRVIRVLRGRPGQESS